MKSIFISILFSLISSLSFAGNIPQAELDKVNLYLTQLLGSYGEMAPVQITAAERSDQTNELTSVDIYAEVLEVVTVEMGIKAETQDRILFNASASGVMADLGITLEYALEMVEAAKEYAETINKRGDYVATIKLDTAPSGMLLTFLMVPSSTNTKPSIAKLEVNGMMPLDTSKEMKVSMIGQLNSGAENVQIVKTSVTNIFNSLLAEEEPSGRDFEAILRIIFDIMR